VNFSIRLRVAAHLCLALAGTCLYVQPASAIPQAAAPQPSIRERLNRVGPIVFSRPEQINEAIKELKDILAVEPNSAEAHLLLGLAYRTVGSPEMISEAKAELVQAVSLDPAFVPARFYLASMYLEQGRPAQAKEEMESALTQIPARPQFLAILGEAERQLNNPRHAAELNRQALQADDTFMQARYYLALALFDLQHRDEAIRELEKVVGTGAKVVDPYLTLGSAYIDAGRTDAAIQTLRQGIQIDAKRPDLRIQLARAYRVKGLFTQAREQLKLAAPANAPAQGSTYAQQQIDTDLYLETGLLELQQGRLTAAVAALSKVLMMEPDQGPANRAIAEAYFLQGAYARSAEYAARAEKLGYPLPEAKRKLLEEKLRSKGMMAPR
jgi:tetratricopeptide (TPR) repeat protein